MKEEEKDVEDANLADSDEVGNEIVALRVRMTILKSFFKKHNSSTKKCIIQ